MVPMLQNFPMLLVNHLLLLPQVCLAALEVQKTLNHQLYQLVQSHQLDQSLRVVLGFLKDQFDQWNPQHRCSRELLQCLIRRLDQSHLLFQ